MKEKNGIYCSNTNSDPPAAAIPTAATPEEPPVLPGGGTHNVSPVATS